MMLFSTGLGWSVFGSLGWTWIAVGPATGSGCCASLQKQEAKGVDGGLRP